jgi:transcriptional regulator with XRE-family HTH domain
MNIKEYLKRNNLSVAKLSKLTGYNDSTIHHWIAGTREISKSSVMHLELLELYNTEHDVFPIQKKRLK